jgi:flavin-dependent dehydrogenase
MFLIKNSLAFILTLIFSSTIQMDAQSQNIDYDIVIYGGTSAGIAAAIQSSRMGKSVIMIEQSSRIGGLTTGGLGQTDIGNKQVIGGISREFYEGIKKYYDDPANWKWQTKQEYRDSGQTRTAEGEDAMWTFEPSAALKVYETMMGPEKITVVYNQRLNRKNGVKMQGQRISVIEMDTGEKYRGKMFIDATYEGDLMATAGVSYSVGRESNSEFGESLNGVQANRVGMTLRRTISRNSIHLYLEI